MTTLARRLPPRRLVTLADPVVRGVLAARGLHRLLDGGLLVLHVVGRTTGRRYDLPVGYADLDGTLLVITQHRWRLNLRDVPDVEVTHDGRRQRLLVELDEDAAAVARQLDLLQQRRGTRALARLTGLVVDRTQPPSRGDLEAAVREHHLALLQLRRPPPS